MKKIVLTVIPIILLSIILLVGLTSCGDRSKLAIPTISTVGYILQYARLDEIYWNTNSNKGQITCGSGIGTADLYILGE